MQCLRISSPGVRQWLRWIMSSTCIHLYCLVYISRCSISSHIGQDRIGPKCFRGMQLQSTKNNTVLPDRLFSLLTHFTIFKEIIQYGRAEKSRGSTMRTRIGWLRV